MSNLIDSLTIRGFRCLSELHIPTLGKVNLITGKNNAGKSSVLEAIRIFVSKASPDTLRAILSYREELTPPSGIRPGYEQPIEPEDFDLVRSLFLNYPDILTQQTSELSISATGSFASKLDCITIKPTWLIKRQSDDDLETLRYSEYTEIEDAGFGEGDGRPALSLKIGKKRRSVSLSTLLRRRSSNILRSAMPSGDGIGEVPNLYLDPFSAKGTNQLGPLWDEIALTDAEDVVLKALQLISPDIQAISMIGGGDRLASDRTAIVRSTRFQNPIPLRSYGDGMNRLFGIILSMCNVRQGILLIDEFENGLHYSVQPLIWKTIFQLARDLDVQVFATTHSRDCIQAFQQAAAESPEDGQLTRLTRKGEHILSTTFTEAELKIVADNDIEVR